MSGSVLEAGRSSVTTESVTAGKTVKKAMTRISILVVTTPTFTTKLGVRPGDTGGFSHLPVTGGWSVSKRRMRKNIENMKTAQTLPPVAIAETVNAPDLEAGDVETGCVLIPETSVTAQNIARTAAMRVRRNIWVVICIQLRTAPALKGGNT